MANDVAIRVKNLGKRYKLGQQSGGYKTLGETITNAVKSPFQRLQPSGFSEEKEEAGTFWALKDVSFEVKKGEAIGIIGRNGAGKSTLLKILSRITAPTEGTVEVHGRIGSLLEVGTGFHPELTGRENIFLSGSIMGMKKAEIEEKFDDIVKFAEIEKFLDTPVKRYSSGMYVRLAFAVAAHLEPEILIIDEVLAVGDAAFQKKCLGKMGDAANSGKTVLFVSHNMNAIESLCSRALLLEQGNKIYDSENVRDVILTYTYKESNDMEWKNPGNLYNSPWFSPQRIFFTNNLGEEIVSPFTNSEDHYLNICGNVQQLNIALQVGYVLYNESNEVIYWSNCTDDIEENWPKISIGSNTFITKIPKRFLNTGNYSVELFVGLYCREWICQPGVNSPIVTFEIEGGLSDSPYWMVRRPGNMAPLLDWRVKMDI